MIFLCLKKFFRYRTCKYVLMPMMATEISPKTMIRILSESLESVSCTLRCYISLSSLRTRPIKVLTWKACVSTGRSAFTVMASDSRNF